MRTVPSSVLPDPAEWDFRNVSPAEFYHVTTYEYARSCPWIVALWDSWLDGTIPEMKVVKAGEPVCDWDETRRTAIRKTLREKYPEGIPFATAGVDVIQSKMLESFPWPLSSVGLEYILLSVPQFPVAYFKLSGDQRARLLKVPHLYGWAENNSGAAFRDAGPPGAEPCERVVVDWQRKSSQIKQAFNVWLDTKLPEKKKSLKKVLPVKIGKAAAPPYHLLAWLAAYRIREAGIAYRAAQAELEKAKNNRSAVSRAEIICELPVYQHQSTWSMNADSARDLIARLFTPVSDSLLSEARIAPLRL
jgi:hypothetical protein